MTRCNPRPMSGPMSGSYCTLCKGLDPLVRPSPGANTVGGYLRHRDSVSGAVGALSGDGRLAGGSAGVGACLTTTNFGTVSLATQLTRGVTLAFASRSTTDRSVITELAEDVLAEQVRAVARVDVATYIDNAADAIVATADHAPPKAGRRRGATDPPLVFETKPGVLRVRLPRQAVGLSPAARAVHVLYWTRGSCGRSGSSYRPDR